MELQKNAALFIAKVFQEHTRQGMTGCIISRELVETAWRGSAPTVGSLLVKASVVEEFISTLALREGWQYERLTDKGFQFRRA